MNRRHMQEIEKTPKVSCVIKMKFVTERAFYIIL